MDFNIKLKNGQILRGMIQSPGENVIAVIIMVHGLGEHIGRYQKWAELFRREGIAFAGVDLPGHGRSEGRRGHIKNFSLLREMIDILVDSVKRTFPGIPVFLYGHSLGGGIVLDYLVNVKPSVKGAVVTSPWLKLAFEPEKSKVLLASVVKNVLPSLTQPSGLVVDHISHSGGVIEAYKADPLIHGQISVSLFSSAVKAASHTLKNARELKVPLLLIHGSDDTITSPEGSREFASGNSFVEFHLWNGGFHELHNDSFSDEIFALEMKWIHDQIG